MPKKYMRAGCFQLLPWMKRKRGGEERFLQNFTEAGEGRRKIIVPP